MSSTGNPCLPSEVPSRKSFGMPCSAAAAHPDRIAPAGAAASAAWMRLSRVSLSSSVRLRPTRRSILGSRSIDDRRMPLARNRSTVSTPSMCSSLLSSLRGCSYGPPGTAIREATQVDRGRNGRGHVDNFQAHDPEVCRLAGRTIPRFAALPGARSLGLPR